MKHCCGYQFRWKTVKTTSIVWLRLPACRFWTIVRNFARWIALPTCLARRWPAQPTDQSLQKGTVHINGNNTGLLWTDYLPLVALQTTWSGTDRACDSIACWFASFSSNPLDNCDRLWCVSNENSRHVPMTNLPSRWASFDRFCAQIQWWNWPPWSPVWTCCRCRESTSADHEQPSVQLRVEPSKIRFRRKEKKFTLPRNYPSWRLPNAQTSLHQRHPATQSTVSTI